MVVRRDAMSVNINGKFLEVAAAAKRLNVSESTIRRLIREDKSIAAIKIRGTWRIAEKSLEAYLQKELAPDDCQGAR